MAQFCRYITIVRGVAHNSRALSMCLSSHQRIYILVSFKLLYIIKSLHTKSALPHGTNLRITMHREL